MLRKDGDQIIITVMKMSHSWTIYLGYCGHIIVLDLTLLPTGKHTTCIFVTITVFGAQIRFRCPTSAVIATTNWSTGVRSAVSSFASQRKKTQTISRLRTQTNITAKSAGRMWYQTKRQIVRTKKKNERTKITTTYHNKWSEARPILRWFEATISLEFVWSCRGLPARSSGSARILPRRTCPALSPHAHLGCIICARSLPS